MNNNDVKFTYEDFGSYDTVTFSLNKLPDVYNIQLDYIKFDDEGKVKEVKSVATGIVGTSLDEIQESLNHLILSGVLNDYYVDLESSHIFDIDKEVVENTTFFVDKFSHYFVEEEND